MSTWRPGLAALILLGLLWGPTVYGVLHSDSRVSPAVQAAIRSASEVDLVITVDFEPESFHIAYFQQFGALGGISHRRIVLRQVSVERVADLKRVYWIQNITVAAPRD